MTQNLTDYGYFDYYTVHYMYDFVINDVNKSEF